MQTTCMQESWKSSRTKLSKSQDDSPHGYLLEVNLHYPDHCTINTLISFWRLRRNQFFGSVFLAAWLVGLEVDALVLLDDSFLSSSSTVYRYSVLFLLRFKLCTCSLPTFFFRIVRFTACWTLRIGWFFLFSFGSFFFFLCFEFWTSFVQMSNFFAVGATYF